MYMTEEDINQFVNELLKVENIFLSKDGDMLFTQEMSRKIANDHNIELEEGAVFATEEVVPYLLQMEDRKRAAAASLAKKEEESRINSEETVKVTVQEDSVSETILEVLEVIKKHKRNDTYVIATAILEELPHLAEVQRNEATAYAEKEGIIDSAEILNNALKSSFKKNSFLKKVSELRKSILDDEDFADTISKIMITNQRHDIVKYYFMNQALNDSSLGLSQELIDRCSEGFFDKLRIVIVNEYKNTTSKNSIIAQDIRKKYGDLNMTYLMDCLKDIDPPLEVDRITFLLYLAEDKEQVEKILRKKELTALEKAEKLRDLEIEFPDWCVKTTLDEIKKQGAIKLPFDEIYDLYIGKAESVKGAVIEIPLGDGKTQVMRIKSSPIGKETEETASTELVIVPSRTIATLPIDTDFEDVPDPIDLEQDEENDKPKKWVITERQKEEKKLEQKKTIACVLAAAGGISTALLVAIYKADAISSATNCFAAMEPLVAKLTGLSELIPSKDQFIAILTALGGTLAAAISYFRFNKKKKALNEENENIILEEEVVLDSEELDDEERTRGGR